MIELSEKIIIPCSFGNIVAERNPDDNYKELWVYVEKDGQITQDLAIIREEYHYDSTAKETNGVVGNGNVEVLVYADKDEEDFTDEFIIEIYEED